MRQELRNSWPKVSVFVPKPPQTGVGRPREYPPEVLFEALLRTLFQGRPLRSPLGRPYPSPAPLHRELMFWIATGAFRGIWRAYLKASSAPVRAAWARALLEPKPGKRGMDNRHLALRRNSYWFIVAVEDLRSREGRR